MSSIPHMEKKMMQIGTKLIVINIAAIINKAKIIISVIIYFSLLLDKQSMVFVHSLNGCLLHPARKKWHNRKIYLINELI